MSEPGPTPPARLVPDRPLPPYTFVPGRAPHPISDPAGHSHGVARLPPAAVDPEHWHASPAYLYGLDLFNAQYYWEAHEQLEGLWLSAGRSGPLADFLKGLIKMAAAGVKHLEGKPAGVTSHARRAAELFRETAAGAAGRFLGLAVADLVRLAESIAASGWPDSPPWLVPALPPGAAGPSAQA